jgi:hypothetical protein
MIPHIFQDQPLPPKPPSIHQASVQDLKTTNLDSFIFLSAMTPFPSSQSTKATEPLPPLAIPSFPLETKNPVYTPSEKLPIPQVSPAFQNPTQSNEQQ